MQNCILQDGLQDKFFYSATQQFFRHIENKTEASSVTDLTDLQVDFGMFDFFVQSDKFRALVQPDPEKLRKHIGHIRNFILPHAAQAPVDQIKRIV